MSASDSFTRRHLLAAACGGVLGGAAGPAVAGGQSLTVAAFPLVDVIAKDLL